MARCAVITIPSRYTLIFSESLAQHLQVGIPRLGNSKILGISWYCHIWHISCHILHILHISCYILHITEHILHIFCHVVHIFCRHGILHIFCHIKHIFCHISCCILHISCHHLVSSHPGQNMYILAYHVFIPS